MGTVTDLPIRESTTPRQEIVPANFTITMPSIWQWMKAGIGFTLGAGIVWIAAYSLWLLFLVNILLGWARITAKH